MTYSRSARGDLRIWAMALIGLVFVYAGSTIDPASNCSSDGDCAPWLVPVAKWLGVAFALSGLCLLAANPRRGSMIDPDTGDLVWWQRRVGSASGDGARIHPSRISLIRIVRDSDSADQVHLYDRDGVRQPFFDSEVVPWPQDRWVERLRSDWPHIRVEVKD